MTRTEYTWMTTEELLCYVEGVEAPTPLEVELAQRLDVMTAYIEDHHDPGRASQS